jgi:hypothetical protein
VKYWINKYKHEYCIQVHYDLYLGVPGFDSLVLNSGIPLKFAVPVIQYNLSYINLLIVQILLLPLLATGHVNIVT